MSEFSELPEQTTLTKEEVKTLVGSVVIVTVATVLAFWTGWWFEKRDGDRRVSKVNTELQNERATTAALLKSLDDEFRLRTKFEKHDKEACRIISELTELIQDQNKFVAWRMFDLKVLTNRFYREWDFREGGSKTNPEDEEVKKVIDSGFEPFKEPKKE